MRTPALLFLLALLVHGAWALTTGRPTDWDPAYYLDVARHIAAGHGAVTGALWSLGWLPPALPFPADLHWMPVPSRVLAPGVWAWPAHGAQVVTVLLAAAWAPVAWGTARLLDASPREAALAGLFAAFGGGYARFLSTPDSIAVYGLVGALAFGFAVRERWLPVVLLAALAALTRGDGFLLAPCLALAFRGRASLAIPVAARPGWALFLSLLPRFRTGGRHGAPAALRSTEEVANRPAELRGWFLSGRSTRLAVAVSGPLAAGAWYLRNLALAGDGYLVGRSAMAHALSYDDLVHFPNHAISLLDRLGALGRALPGLVVVALLIGLFILPWPALWEAWARRRTRVLRAAVAYGLAVLLVPVLAAPAVGSSGTPFRSWSALFPLLCALAAAGTCRLGDRAARARGYPRWFLPGLVAGGVALGSLLVGGAAWRLGPRADFDCAELPREPILAADPLLVTGACDLPAVVLSRRATAREVEGLAARYGLRYAFLAAPDDGRANLARPDDAARLLAGWEPLTERLYRRPVR